MLSAFGEGVEMSRYRRMYVPGGTYFFTVNLALRGSDLLVRRVEVLREAVRVTKAERPFRIEAWVVMPDHLHAVWTLPEGDADFSVRWGANKGRISRGVRRAGFTPRPTLPQVQTGAFNGENPGLPIHLQRRHHTCLHRGGAARRCAARSPHCLSSAWKIDSLSCPFSKR